MVVWVIIYIYIINEQPISYYFNKCQTQHKHIIIITMLESQSESWVPTRYPSTKDQFNSDDRYIAGLTREDVSQYITNFPFIYHIYKKNQPHDQWRLLDQFMKVPSQADGPGFIYGFMNENQNSLLEAPYWIKIGRTKQNPPQQRIFQWQRDDNIEITQIFTVRTLYQKKLQALVHILFGYARQQRQINGHQRKQWFHFEQITLTAAGVNILNHIMNTIHTTKLQKKKNLYLNRSLKQITEKLTQSNNQLQDVISHCNKFVVESFVRDLGIQLGNNDAIKLQIKDATSIADIIQIICNTVIGKQMKLFFDNATNLQFSIGKLLDSIKQFKKQAQTNLRQIYDRTKVNIYVPSQTEPELKKNQQNNLKLPKQADTKQRQKKKQTKSKMQKSKQKKKKSNTTKQQDELTNHSPIEVQTYKVQIKQVKLEKGQKAKKSRTKEVSRSNSKEGKRSKRIKENSNKNKSKSKSPINQKSKSISNQEEQAIEYFINRQQAVGSIEEIQLINAECLDDFEEVRNMMMNLSISGQTAQVDVIEVKSSKQENSRKVSVYGNQGKITREQSLSVKQCKQYGRNLAKYKVGSQLDVPASTQAVKKNSMKQKQIKDDQTTIPPKILQIKLQSMSEIKDLINTDTASESIGYQFVNYIDTFQLDCLQIKLQWGFIIITKQFHIKQPTIIKKSNRFKGFLKVFCFRAKGIEFLDIQKMCERYVGVYEVKGDQVMALDQYHMQNNTINQAIRQTAMKLHQIF